VARGPPVGAPGGELFSLCGKLLRHCDFCSPVPLCFLLYRSFYADSFCFRLKRTLEQAQPSMAKRLEAGAASEEPGLWLTFGTRDVLMLVIIVTGLHSSFCRFLRLSSSGRRCEHPASSRACPVAADAGRGAPDSRARGSPRASSIGGRGGPHYHQRHVWRQRDIGGCQPYGGGGVDLPHRVTDS